MLFSCLPVCWAGVAWVCDYFWVFFSIEFTVSSKKFELASQTVVFRKGFPGFMKIREFSLTSYICSRNLL